MFGRFHILCAFPSLSELEQETTSESIRRMHCAVFGMYRVGLRVCRGGFTLDGSKVEDELSVARRTLVPLVKVTGWRHTAHAESVACGV